MYARQRSVVQICRCLQNRSRVYPAICGDEISSGRGGGFTGVSTAMGALEVHMPLPTLEGAQYSLELAKSCNLSTFATQSSGRSEAAVAAAASMWSGSSLRCLLLPAARHCSSSPELDTMVARARNSPVWTYRFEKMRMDREARRDAAYAESLEIDPGEVTSSKTNRRTSCVSAQLLDPIMTGAPPELRLTHPTALVHPDALLGEGVEIGAYCTVGPHVKLGRGCKLHPGSHIFGQTQLGEKCVLLTGAVVGADIPGQTTIGDNNTIGHHAVVGVKCQDMKYKDGDECFLYIGNNNDIREFASIHLSSKPDDKTMLGNDNLIMGSCHIAHDCKIGHRNILANSTLLGGHVVLEDLVHTGGAVAVHQFCNIGSYSFLAGGSMVDRDVPKFMMVAGDRAELRGLNLEGMRRCGFSDLEVRSIRKAYQKLFMNSDSNAGGMEERLSGMEHNEEFSTVPAVKLMLQSVRDCFGEKRRGICRFRHWTTV